MKYSLTCFYIFISNLDFLCLNSSYKSERKPKLLIDIINQIIRNIDYK